ncbi:hypothetical protein ORG37_05930 [Rahnella perminowiae]|nr:hypothetical protein [Rahnella perminowiae]MCX2942644.1 hypothetical protein [Rahnella perminowiae]
MRSTVLFVAADEQPLSESTEDAHGVMPSRVDELGVYPEQSLSRKSRSA